MPDITKLRGKVSNRGRATIDFLNTLIHSTTLAPDEIFAERKDQAPPNVDIYTKVRGALGSMTGKPIIKRKAFMCEVIRVLALFESSDNWREDADSTNPEEDRPETMSAGVLQISHDSLAFGQDLRDMCAARGIKTAERFREIMMDDHEFALVYGMRLLRHTDRHNGPVHRHEIDKYLSVDAMNEFEAFLIADAAP